MDTLRMAKFEAQERGIKCCNQNPAAVALNPIFKSDKDFCETKLLRVRPLMARIAEVTAHAENKEKIKNNLLDTTLDACVILTGYALTQENNAALFKLTKHSKSSLTAGKEDAAFQRIEAVLAKTRELSTELKDKRGVSEAFFTQFETRFAQYKDVRSEPRDAIQERKILNTEMDALLEEVDVAFTILVSSSLNLKGIADDFLARFNNDKTIPTKPGATKLLPEVKDGVTGEKLFDFGLTSHALGLSHQVTNPKHKGVKTTHHAEADVTVTKEGYHSVTHENQKIAKNKTNRMTITLMPIGTELPPEKKDVK